MSHVTCMNESRHIFEWVTSHVWMSHVTCMNESHHTWLMRMNESRLMYENSFMHKALFCVTCMNASRILCACSRSVKKSRHKYVWVTPYVWIRHVFIHIENVYNDFTIWLPTEFLISRLFAKCPQYMGHSAKIRLLRNSVGRQIVKSL